MALTEVEQPLGVLERAARHLGRRRRPPATTRTTCGSRTPCASTSTRSPAAAIRTCSTSSSPWTSRRCAQQRCRRLRQRRDVPGAVRTSPPTAAPRKNRTAPTCSSADLRHGDADPRGAGRALREDRRHLECARADGTGINWVANNEFSVIFAAAGLHHAGRRLRLRAAEPRLRLRRARQHEVRCQLRRDHRPSGLGRHPGRTDARPAGAHRRRHRRAGQSGPEAARVDELSTCRSSGTTPKAATCRWATSTRTSTTTSASPRSSRRRSTCRIRGRRATSTRPWPTAVRLGDHDLHPQLHLRQPRRRSWRDGAGVDANGNRTGIIAGQPGDPIATSASPCRRTSDRPSSMAWSSASSTCSATAASACRRTTRWSIRTWRTTTTIAASSSRSKA